MTSTVSSPANVPKMPTIDDRSIADARYCAAPGGVRSTTVLSWETAETSSSSRIRGSFASRLSPVDCCRDRSPPSPGTAYTDPAVDRIFTAPTSARSRDRVAWVTVMPCVASASASSIWDRTDWRVMRSMIFCCRAVFVSGALLFVSAIIAPGGRS